MVNWPTHMGGSSKYKDASLVSFSTGGNGKLVDQSELIRPKRHHTWRALVVRVYHCFYAYVGMEISMESNVEVLPTLRSVRSRDR